MSTNTNRVTVVNNVRVARTGPNPFGCLIAGAFAIACVVMFFAWPLFVWHGLVAIAAEAAWVVTLLFIVSIPVVLGIAESMNTRRPRR